MAKTPEIDDVLKKYGAVTGESPKPELVFSMSVEGLESVGKTRFGLLTCPLPIVHVNFSDRDATVFRYDMSPERDAQTTFYHFKPEDPAGWTRAEGERSVLGLSEIARAHLSEGRLAGGTFILDSGSSWWETMQEVYVKPELERSEKRRGGLEYTKANLIVSGVVSWIKSQGAYAVITHRKTQDWDKDGPIPGKYSAQANRKIPFLVEIRLDLKKTCSTCGAGLDTTGSECQARGHLGRKYTGRILKLGHGEPSSLEGIEIDNPTFSEVYTLYARGQEYPYQERLV